MPTKLPPRPAASPLETDERLRWVVAVSRLMDSQFSLPGTRFRFGLDPILGLLPVVGDLTSMAISGAMLLTMMRHGASGSLVVRMALNILLDATIGSIPILGSIFDFTYKANNRNVALLRAHYAEGKYSGSGKGLIAVVLIVMLAVFGLIAWGLWAALSWLWAYGGQNWW